MVATNPRLRDDIDEIIPGVIADRRRLHQHPELAFQEVETSRLVAERLRALGVEDIRTGIAKTGITGLIRGTTEPAPGQTPKVVMVRADMDALPIHEENEVDYKSRHEGVMHACGHDAHTAILLAVTRLLMERRDQFAGTVKVLFQPAEEAPPGGAKPMIEAGVLEDPHVDAAFGLHIGQDQPLGTIAVRAGQSSAASDRFNITIKGKGAHGAHPDLGIDPIVVGAQIVLALQTLVSREVDPTESAVVTVGAFNAGNAMNVIPDTATLKGTVRTFNPEIRQLLAERLEALVRGVATAMRAEIALDYSFGYPSVVNDAALTDLVRSVATEAFGPERVLEAQPKMGGEDMAYYLERVPGCFFRVGSRNPDKGFVWGHHHPRFDFDEDALPVGIETMTRVVLRYLGESVVGSR